MPALPPKTRPEPPEALLLASTSPWRLRLLLDAGVPARAVDPGAAEAGVPAGEPVATARARARAKARAVAGRHPGALVCGADQVVHLDGELIGKPADEDDWRRRLRALRWRTHLLTTAVALVRRPAEEPGAAPAVDEVFHVDARVTLRSDLTDDEIEAYIALGEARGCAGGYMVERRGAWLVERIDGDWLNVVGLPVLDLVGRLRRLGWRLGPGGARPAGGEGDG